MKSTSATETIINFAYNLHATDIPPAVTNAVKLQLLDTLGCIVAAESFSPVGPRMLSLAEPVGECTAVLAPFGVSMARAALVNGALAHALDFDDTHAAAHCHVSAVVLSAAIAAAEHSGATGSELLVAAVAGSEVAIQVGMLARGAFAMHAFHATPMTAIFGAVAAVARLLGLSEYEARQAIGIAASFAAGLGEPYRASPTADTKSIQTGWAASSAVEACLIARTGVSAPAHAIEGDYGLFASHLGSDAPDTEAVHGLAETLGRVWHTQYVALKLYPACHGIHACMHSLHVIQDKHDVHVANIQKITAYLPKYAIKLVALPHESKLRASHGYDAKFSVYLSLACMALDGRVDNQTYTDESVQRPEVRSIAHKVSVEEYAFKTGDVAFPGGVRVETSHGTFTELLELERGNRDDPLSLDEVREKFVSNTAHAMDESHRAGVISFCVDLESVADIRPHVRALRRKTRSSDREAAFGRTDAAD